MLFRKLAVVSLVVFLSVQLRFAGAATQSTAHDLSAAAPTDVIASPALDPDPRDETSIAVSPVNNQIVVGASKVLVGAGSAPPGTIASGAVRVAYYYSSDGGATFGSSILP